MKMTDVLIAATVVGGLYFLYRTGQDSGIPTGYPSDLPGAPSGFAPSNPLLPSGSSQITVVQPAQPQPQSYGSSSIFTKTTANAQDRFLIAPGTNDAGVYDRYAQQSIRKETAVVRSIFGTPSVK